MSSHALTQATLGLLKSLIAFDTTSRNSNLELIHFVVDYLSKHGIASTLVQNDDGTKANLYARIGPEAEGGYVFSGHTDVVPVDGQECNTPPFELTQKGDKLYGRGTADMKSFVAIALALVPKLTSLPLKKPVYLAFSYDEEVGCLGAHSLVRLMEDMNISPELAIIGEPTEMRVVNAHKGIVSFETKITGLEAHSSNTHKGVNAIMVAGTLIGCLKKLAEQYQAKDRDIRFDPPYTTIHVGVIHGGTARNIIPKDCSFLWEIRPLHEKHITAIRRDFDEAVAHALKEMHKVDPNTTIETKETSQTPPLTPDDDMTSEHLLMHMTASNHIHAVSFCTEAGIFNQGGFPAIVCGPGSIDQAHKPNEFIEIKEIESCLALLEKLIIRLL